MLKPQNRLKKVRDFNLVLKHGKWVGNDLISLKILNLDKLNPKNLPKIIKNGTTKEQENFKKQLRLAIACGLKIHKNAVKRNRLKRQVSEVVRLIIKDKKLKVGYYILIQPKKELLLINDQERMAKISQNLKLLFKTGKILV